MGKEYHDVGAHVPLSICMGPMGRSVFGGRNWESFSSDPYLTGEAARLSVQGFQDQGVVGLVKCAPLHASHALSHLLTRSLPQPS